MQLKEEVFRNCNAVHQKIFNLFKNLTMMLLLMIAGGSNSFSQEVELLATVGPKIYYGSLEYSTAEEYFSSIQAQMSGPSYDGTYSDSVGNIRPSINNISINGKMIFWIWDRTRTYSNGDSVTWEEGQIALGYQCPATTSGGGVQENSKNFQYSEHGGLLSYEVECLVFGQRPVSTESRHQNMCSRSDGRSSGNPIDPATRQKYYSEVDYQDHSGHPLNLIRNYSSSSEGSQTWFNHESGEVVMGSEAAVVSLLPKIKWDPERMPVDGNQPISNGPFSPKFLLKLGGEVGYFLNSPDADGNYHGSNPDNILTYEAAPNSPYRRIKIYRQDEKSTYLFESYLITGTSTRRIEKARLISVTDANGWVRTYTYAPTGQLAQVQNHFGRSLGFVYNAAGLLAQVNTPDGQHVSYAYDGNDRLQQVTYPDSATRSFHYENSSYPQALTGISTNGTRLATYTYDTEGRAIETQHAGGVERYQVDYLNSTIATVTDPLGTQRTYGYSTKSGKVAVTSASQPSGEGLPDASNRVQEPDGLISSETDFQGAVTQYAWDTTRRLPLTITQAAGTADERVTTLQWHPSLRLPTLVTEPGRSTTSSYDSKGNLLSQTVTDTAAVPPVSRTWQWTYNPQGLVATATEPNGAVTSYQYNSAGNVIQATNALGQADTYTYDSAGRVLSHTAPTGLVSSYTWDVRGRLLSSSAGGLATTMAYNAIGKLASLTQPSGLITSYTYDAAHRLTGWSNNRGESGHYMLDAMGNRIDEYVQDSQSAIAWETSRSINSLNRLDTETLGADQTRSYGYDSNGEPISSTNALSQSTQHTLDALRRVRTVTNSQYAIATLDYTGDHLTDVTDFAGNATLYVRDAQGNPKREVSDDAGDSTATYDALGLPSQITNALGQATSITRDSLGRPTSIVRADGTTTLRYDLTGTTYNATGAPNASKGLLSEIQDPGTGTGVGITTRYQRDALGRIVKKTQILAASAAPAPVAAANTRSISYSYVANGAGAGQLASLTYPSGGVLGYSYDASGRISALSWNGTPLVSNLTWTPLGQPSGWTWNLISGSPTSPVASRSYTTAGQLASASLGGSELASYQYDAAGRVISLRQSTMVPTATGSTVAALPIDTTFTYDPVGRITASTHSPVTPPSLPTNIALSAITGPTSASYSYDANGNRSQSLYQQTSATGSTLQQQRDFTVDTQSNRLLGHTKTESTDGSQTSTADADYQYNAAGQLTHTGATGLALAYDAAGRMGQLAPATTPAQTTRYQHNALGQRVRKLDASKNTITLYGEAEQGMESMPLGLYSSTTATGATEVIYLPTASGPMPIATLVKGVKYAIHSDHLNTPRRLIQTDGKVAWQWVTSAFGEVPPTTGKTRFVSPKVNPATTGTTTLANFDLRYPGQVEDTESGLFYNHRRFYGPLEGRYLQSDPVGLAGGWNRLLYAGGDAVNNFDPDGLNFVSMANWAATRAQWMYYRYGPAIAEFMAGASGVNGAVVSPMSPLVGQIPGAVSRLSPVSRAIAEGVESGAFCAAGETARVGRWMSQVEYDAMKFSGRVQESFSGTTHVANPADAAAFINQAKPGSLYVEFNVPMSSLRATNEGWSKVIGPNSLEGRLAARKGQSVPQMPIATDIFHSSTRLP